MKMHHHQAGILAVAIVFHSSAAFAHRDTNVSHPMVTETWAQFLQNDDRKRYHSGVREHFPVFVMPQCVVVGVQRGWLACYDRSHGFQRWKLHIGHPLVSGIATDETSGYGVSQDGVVFRFGLHTGHLFWKEFLHKGIVAQPLLAQGALYLLTTTNELWKFDLEKRQVVWRYRGDVFERTSLVGGTRPVFLPQANVVIVGQTAGSVSAVRADTGTQVWRVSLPIQQAIDDVDGAIVELPGERFVLSSAYSTTVVIDSKGNVLYTWPFGSVRGSAVVTHGGKARLVQGDVGVLRMLDMDTKQVISLPIAPEEGFPLRPHVVEGPLVMVAWSEGGVLVWNIETSKYEWIRKGRMGPGFSSVPWVEGASAFLFGNYGNLWRWDFDIARLTVALR